MASCWAEGQPNGQLWVVHADGPLFAGTAIAMAGILPASHGDGLAGWLAVHYPPTVVVAGWLPGWSSTNQPHGGGGWLAGWPSPTLLVRRLVRAPRNAPREALAGWLDGWWWVESQNLDRRFFFLNYWK